MNDGGYTSDALLVEGLRRQEAAAEEAFFDRYMPFILARLRRVMDPRGTGAPAELEDLGIIIADRLLRKVSGTEPVTNLRALVAKTAFNTGIDWYRREKRRREQESDEDVAEVSPENLHNDVRDDPEVRSADYVPINPEAAAAFSEALAALDPEEQRLLLLRAKGDTYEEIAIMLRDEDKPVKEATWRKRYERAYEKLLRACRKFAEEKPDVLRALEEGQRQIQEKKRIKPTEAL